MSYSEIKYWRRFSDYIIAVSEEEGKSLHDFIHQVRLDETILDNYEIMDFQRYRVLRKRGRIAAFLQASEKEQRFKFLVSKN